MNIDRKELLAALNAVNPGLAKRDLIEQSTDFLFTDGIVATYNDEITVSHPVKGINFTGAVPGEELRKILEKTKDIYVELEADKELTITGEKFKASIRMESELKLPINTIQTGEFKSIPSNFIDAIKVCIFSVGKDMAKPILTCIHIKDKIVESCDNYRVTRSSLAESIKEEMLIPAKAAQHLIKYDIQSYSIADAWISFKTKDNCLFSCRTFSGEYPDLSPIAMIEESSVLKFPKGMNDILERASIALSDNQEVDITIENNTVTVKSDGDVVRYEESTRMRSHALIKFSINPDFLRQILTKHSDAAIANDFSKMKFFGETFDHIISL